MSPPAGCSRKIALYQINVARLDFGYIQEFTPFALTLADQIRSDMSADRACCSDRGQMVSSAVFSVSSVAQVALLSWGWRDGEDIGDHQPVGRPRSCRAAPARAGGRA